jgi:hypothetical protein
MTGLIGVAHAPSPYRASNQRSDDGTLKVVQTVDCRCACKLPLFYPSILSIFPFILFSIIKGYGTVELCGLRYMLV